MIAVRADTHPEITAWRAFLWTVPVAVFWTALTYRYPTLQASGVPTVAIRVSVHVLIALGLWLGLTKVELAPSRHRNVWLAIMVPYTLWLAVIWSAAINGAFKPGNATPLLPIAVFLPIFIGAPALLRSKRIAEVLDVTPASWLVGLQCYRLISNGLLVGWARGVIPGVFALPAGLGDMIIGLFAVPVALAAAADTAGGRLAAIAWNIFGLIDLAVAVTILLAITPGPLQVIVPNIPVAGGGLYPGVLVPAFGVPVSILLHALSLRQLRRRAKAC